MYKLLKSSDDLSGQFHRNLTTREEELPNNKKTKRSYPVTSLLNDVSGFAQLHKMLHMD